MMYDIALLIHLCAMIAIFLGIAAEWMILLNTRRAHDVAEARTWARYGTHIGPLYGVAAIALIATGLYMLHDSFADTQPWALISLAVLVILMIAGALINGTRFDAIWYGLQTAHGETIPEDVAIVIAGPLLFSSVQFITGQALAVVMLMTLKPGWRDSLLTLAVWAVVAIVVSMPTWRSRRAVPTPPVAAHR